MSDYLPVFTYKPDTLSEKWELITKFIEQWNSILIPTTDCTKLILELEEKLNVRLPESFKNYITLSTQLLTLAIKFPNGMGSNAYSVLFRDRFVVEKIKNHDAISLMIQGEGDFYWAVRIDDLQLENPPVHGYVLDYEDSNNDKFDYSEQTHSSITAFTISHLLSYTHKNGGFSSNIDSEVNLSSLLKKCFSNFILFEGMEIYEAKNMIAFYPHDPNGIYLKHHLSFHLWKDFKVWNIPKNIIKLSKEKYTCYGVFTRLK